MADDVQDIYVSTGSGTEWQSLSALAAEQVDASLPISSDDGTVVLESPSANVFTVSTGGVERVRVRNDGNVGVGNGGYAFARHTSGGTNVQSGGAAAIAYNAMYTATTDGTGAKPQVFSFYSSPTIVDDPAQPIESFAHFYSAGNIPSNVKNAYGLYVAVQGGQNSYNIYAPSSAPNYFAGDIEIISTHQLRTSTVKGTADSDAQIDLGADVSIKSGNLLVGQYDSKARWQEIRHSTVPAYTTNSLIEESVAESTFSINAHPTSEGAESWKRDGNANYSDAAIRLQSGSFAVGSQILFATAPNKDIAAPITRLTIDKDGDIQANASYTPTQPNSIATKKIVDDKIWVGTTAEYLAIPIRDILPTTLYCLTD